MELIMSTRPSCNRYYNPKDHRETKMLARQLSREKGLGRYCGEEKCLLLNCRQKALKNSPKAILCVNRSCKNGLCMLRWEWGALNNSSQTFCTRDLGSNKDLKLYLSKVDKGVFCPSLTKRDKFFVAGVLGCVFSFVVVPVLIFCYSILENFKK